MPQGRSHSIILLDGHCVLCHRLARFVARHDRAGHFRMGTLQSIVGREILAGHRLPADLATVVLIDQAGAHVRSTATARILRQLPWPWPWMGTALLAMPRPIRDWLYRLVARIRLRIFGRTEACGLPSPELQSRLLGETPAPSAPDGHDLAPSEGAATAHVHH